MAGKANVDDTHGRVQVYNVQRYYSNQRLKPNRKRGHGYGIRYLSFSILKGCHDYSKNRKKVFNPEGVT
ncbi:MAG: hypothetical protein JETT_1924 [Candidatus Jettenia ecosi]|uniref:Uncharacterized protein n=1 Tax=Candidatus Jettenia ecosi TaxID=2494326 RepID=A0A533QAU9_9BACT|nr:MAG: hypothetical protein JETT_1924 [Candidatus Jettenia ecosi]